MTAPQYSLRTQTSRRASGSYQAPCGLLVRFEARTDISCLTFVRLAVSGQPVAGEWHIGDVSHVLAPYVTHAVAAKIVARIMDAILSQAVR